MTILWDFIGQFGSFVTKLLKFAVEDCPLKNLEVYIWLEGAAIVTEVDTHAIETVNVLLVWVEPELSTHYK